MKSATIALSLLLMKPISLPQQIAGTRLEGIVFDGDTDKPLAGVVVQISGLKMTTAADGKFVFTSVPAGKHMLLADKAGYMRARPQTRKRLGSGGIDLTIVSGQPAPSLVLHLFRAGLVTGRIYDSKGAPIQGAVVTPYRQTYDNAGNRTLVRPVLSRNSTVSGIEMMSTLVLGRLGGGAAGLLGYDESSNYFETWLRRTFTVFLDPASMVSARDGYYNVW